MKTSKIILWASLGGAVLVSGSALVYVVGGAGEGSGPSSGKLVSVRQKAGKEAAGKKPVRPKVRRRVDGKLMTDPSVRKPPTFEIGDAEEAKLTEAQKKLLLEIRAMLKADNWRRLTKLIQQLQASDEWPDGVPLSVRKAAIEALSFYGSKCLPEIIGFLGDSNAEIVDDATESFWDSVTDPDLSDLEIQQNLLVAMKAIKNEESIREMLSEVITTSMRNSRAVDTIKKLSAYDSKVIQSELPSVIAELADDAGVTTVSQLDEWLKKNPDDPDDEDMYGGMKDEDDI